MTYQVGDGNTNEVQSVGRAGQSQQFGGTNAALLGFFGATPVVQPTSASQAAVISTAPVSISATQWAFSTSAQALSILTFAVQLRSDLVSLGLIKGS